MGIKRCPLVLNNVLSGKARCKTDEWYDSAIALRNTITTNGLYVTGPIIYQVAKLNVRKNEVDYTFYLPLSAPIKMHRNGKYSFHEVWRFDDGLLLRHGDLEEDLDGTYDALKACARDNKLKLQEPFYNAYLEIFKGEVIDVYASISHR